MNNNNNFMMKKKWLLVLIPILCFGFNVTYQITQIQESLSETEDIMIYDFDSLEPLLYTDTDKTYVVNFWAMWCAPCVKELPYLQEFENKNPEIEVLLVSLDFPEDIESKLKPFLQKKGITSKVVLLDDPNSNSWINRVDPNWSGAIPLTIVFNKNKRSFHSKAFESLEDFESSVNNLSNY